MNEEQKLEMHLELGKSVDTSQRGYIVNSKRGLSLLKKMAAAEGAKIYGKVEYPAIYINHFGTYRRKDMDEKDNLIYWGYELVDIEDELDE